MSAVIDTFFGKFGDLTDDAEQIPHVRKFIVSALIHESLSAKGAVAAADQIRSKHRNAVELKSSAIRRNKYIQELTNEDLPPQLKDLPVQLFGRLDEIATIEKGLSPIQKTKPGPYPLVVTAEERGSSATFDFVGPAVAIPMVSSTGHGDASLKRIHYQEGNFAAGNILSVVKPICPQLINARFLYEYLTAFKEELLVARMSGTANVSLTINKLNEVPIPLITGPALQRLDALMAQCDRLEAQLRERDTRQADLASAALARFSEDPTPSNLNLLFHKSYDITPADLRKTILTLAVRGKLVPQDPNDEPAEVLLSKIRDDHPSPKKGSKARSSQIIEDDLPHEVPFSWGWSCVQELAQPNESVTYGILKPVWVESGVPTVRVTEMKTGVIDVDSLPKCDPQRAAKFSKTTLTEGDLLISKDGTIGKTAFAPADLAGGNITQHMLRFAISKRLNRHYIRLCIDAPPYQAWMVGETKGVALQGVNVGDFRRMPLPVPPLAEQGRIVAKVDQLMTLVDEWEAQLVASRATAKNLLDALVAELTSHSAS